MNRTLKKVCKGVGIALATLALLVVLFFLVLTVTEFRPKQEETVSITGNAEEKVKTEESYTIVSWNIGYAGLDEGEDFFMDGGNSGKTADKETVEDNLSSIIASLQEMNPDIALLQEVDCSSTRTHYVKEKDALEEGMPGYENSFANNYKSLWVPYPWPMLGKVDSGIATYSKFQQASSTRISLPCPFKYPVRLCNLKRCLMVSRIPVDGTDKELVIVNLHLEAYDDGEGKVKQTRQLREFLENEAKKGNYVIAGGDFNQTFSNVDASKFPVISDQYWQPGAIDVSEFSNSLQFIMDDKTASCRSLDKVLKGADLSTFQFYVLDGFIVSDNIQVEEAAVKDLGFRNSDHNPLVMKFSLNP